MNKWLIDMFRPIELFF